MSRLVDRTGMPATKKEARDWLKRIRLDVRDIEDALKSGDWEWVETHAMDIMGAANVLGEIADANKGAAPTTVGSN